MYKLARNSQGTPEGKNHPLVEPPVENVRELPPYSHNEVYHLNKIDYAGLTGPDVWEISGLWPMGFFFVYWPATLSGIRLTYEMRHKLKIGNLS